MASKKKGHPTKFCQILSWVEVQDSALADAIKHLCLTGIFHPRSRPGITFMYPKDKEFREEIVTKAFGEQAEEAVSLIESLVLLDVFRSGAEFGQRPVGSARGIKLAVESADVGRVRFAGGLELVPADDFRVLERGAPPRLAVWLIAKGRPPLEGEPYAPPAPKRRARGGGAPQSLGAPNDRMHLAAKTASEFDCCMRKDLCRGYNPYLARSVSLLRFLQLQHPDEYKKVLPLIDYNPLLTFYFLVEPAKPEPRLLPDELLFGDGGWNGACLFEDAREDYLAFFKEFAARGERKGEPRVFGDRARVAAQADRVRQEIGEIANIRRVPDAIRAAYAALGARNEIAGLGPVFPASTLAALGAAGLLWQGEMRFTIRSALITLSRGPYSSWDFRRVVDDLHTRWTGRDYTAELTLVHPDLLKHNVAPKVELAILMKFVGSTDFLYTPVAPGEVGPGGGDPWDPTQWKPYFNANRFALSELQATGADMRRPSGISPKALLELRTYVARHGTLPAPVQALAAQGASAPQGA
jgi:hypothetical protein